MLGLLLLALAAAMLAAWIAVLLHPARPWDARPVGEDAPAAADPAEWPAVVAVVPARNEARVLPHSLPALISQDYPGELHVVVVDDRSMDGTGRAAADAASAAGRAEKLSVLEGEPLPEGWTGKVWAMQQGARAAVQRQPRYVLFTDADILHSPRSLRRLVAESEAQQLALNSRMARLPSTSFAERLLLPAFVWFFNLLYPMRRVNDPRSPVAAAAGGCMLLATSTIDDIGGLACIADRVIDDVALAREVKRPGRPVRLALSREDVRSLRRHPGIEDVWAMVRRTAFTELGHSWKRLAACLAALAFVVLGPPLTVALGLVVTVLLGDPVALLAATHAAIAWGLMALLYAHAVRLFGLPWKWWAFTLPLATALFGAMTIDSALTHRRGEAQPWRDAPGKLSPS
jgi:hopene-associated glycosyltransferase HpnB